MSTVAGKRIVVGVTGGIAAYKAVEVCRRLVDLGAHVVPVMTKAAEHFIGRTTLSALASEPVQTSLWDEDTPIPHTRLGQTADLIVVVPATARLIGAYAAGLSTDLLTNALLATRAPVVVCPAMHTEMWEHPAVRDNLDLLHKRGVVVVEPDAGRLAGGDVGAGRLATPERIVATIEQVLGPRDLQGVTVLVTAGGTREPIDAVRVIANRSTGKQGYAIAAEAASRGAAVTLISTVALPTPPGVRLVAVETAAEMEAAIDVEFDSTDVVVMAAAVADFRPKAPSAEKLKKAEGPPEIVLEPTPDILAGLGARKRSGQVLVGFAAETSDLLAHAEAKLARKCLDMIVANDVSKPGIGFAHDTNAVTLARPGRAPREVARADKREIARAVIDEIVAVRAHGTIPDPSMPKEPQS